MLVSNAAGNDDPDGVPPVPSAKHGFQEEIIAS
jgi:hypothetical protein